MQAILSPADACFCSRVGKEPIWQNVKKDLTFFISLTRLDIFPYIIPQCEKQRNALAWGGLLDGADTPK